MRPDAISLLAAFLAVGGLEVVAAQDAADANVERPRWYFPREVKRTIRNNRSFNPDAGSLIDNVFENLVTQGSSSQPEITPTPEPLSTPAAAESQKGQEVVVVTISVDPKNPEITHRITGTTTIGGEPTATTTTTTKKTDGSSTDNNVQKNSEVPSTDADTTSQQQSATDSVAKASTTASPSTAASSDGGLLGAVGSGLSSIGDDLGLTDSTSSSAAVTPAAATDSSAQASTAPSSTPSTTAATTATSSSNGGLLGVVGSGLSSLGDDLGLTDSTSSFASVTPAATTDSSVANASTTASPSASASSNDGLLGAVGSGLSSLGDDLGLGGSTSSSASALTSTPATLTDSSAAKASSTPLSTSEGLLGGLGAGLSSLGDDLGLGGSTSSLASATPSASSPKESSTASSGTDLLGMLLGDNSSSGNSTIATASNSSMLPTIPASVPASATTSVSASTTPTSSGDLLGGIVSGVDSLLGITPTGTGSIALIPTASMPAGSLLPSKSTALIPGFGTTTSGGVPTPTNSIGSVPVPHSPGADSTSESATASAPGTGTTSGSVPGSGSSETPKVPTPTSHPASTPLPQTTEVSTTKTAVEPQTTATETPLPSTSNDNDWMPSTILIMPTVATTHTTTSGQTDMPQATSLPGSITPSNEITEAPSDSTLLQLGFNGQLPWSFVATTPLSSSQIFNYTPQAIENALPTLAAKDYPVMFSLEPYYNWQATGYNATLAIFYFPRDKVEALRALKVNPKSALYNQASESIQSLMTMVDPTIPLEFSGNYPSSGDGSSSGNTDSGNNDGTDGGSNNNSDGSASSSKTKASSVGIGVGVVAGAAAYGAGMFWVARRYRKRKQLHQRSSSTVEQMSQGGSAAGSVFAAGGRTSPSQNSRGTARSQMISAPVMAENSLGWN
ncbi:hypothetical protein N7508_004488 [Penicillium antarcticum]|uniref:uncharacterized protein n=1 Tax=Penicillium antarcticum TaxID=416450 RepID=UPI00239DF59A|nr:uncharacterized protein N7508_004488 [Penicillium antarcticum]KAJ5309109.1 hypothetical protein N7508_004488 [Penicillium antarcticum]